MECGEAYKRIAEPVENFTMLTFELEAAEALAGMARSFSLPGEFERRSSCQQVDTGAAVISPQTSQALGGQEFSRETSAMVAGPSSTLKIVETTPNQACNTSNQSKVSGTSRHNLTEAEKEAQRLRRVLANRESARRTIRHRQAMYLELTGKAANLSKENTYLKQERELAVNKYNYLKDKNEFLKAQIAKRKHDGAGHIHDRPKSSHTEISSSAAIIPICLHNRPSLVPFFWPFKSQCASSTDFINASRFHKPVWDELFLSQGQECSTAITKPRPPFFILPVPWLPLPLSRDGKLEFYPATKDQQHEHPSIHQCPMCLSSSTSVHEDTGLGLYNLARAIPASNGHGAGFHFPSDYRKHSFLDKNHRGPFSSSRKPG
ncbi:hypothetical protein F511_03244 [Dorcoceras hygrometricum]|uniref:BZIP domain-containing protein n=1 Tax=Dorcoceras hygrometricum TaxID=472368 RepID=A0A2Z7B285_9LAMI|nr:hypothetical protein F511_03244 [Dorcoceras hygrometricum]